MATHANPGCGTDCTKHAGTQLHRPDRPESPRSRHTPCLTRRLVCSRCALTTRGPPLLRHDSSPKIENTTCSTEIMIECALQTRSWSTNDIATRPHPSQATPAGPPALVALTPRLRPMPPRDPVRQTRQRCARRAAGLNSHWQCQFTRAARRPQRPALPRRHLWVHTLSSPQRLVCDQAPPLNKLAVRVIGGFDQYPK